MTAVATAPRVGGDWARRAACIDSPRLMFPGDGDPDGRAAARAVCRGCPVQAECLADALAQGADGVRGGLTVRERAAMLRQGRSTPGRRRRPRTPRPAARAPRAPRPPTRPRRPPHEVLRAPGLLEHNGVRVAPDGVVSLDDRAWLVASIVLQRHMNLRRERAAGRGRHDRWVTAQHRVWLCGVLHKLGHGVGWKAIPAVYGHHSTMRKLHRRLVRDAAWLDVVAALGPYDDPPGIPPCQAVAGDRPPAWAA